MKILLAEDDTDLGNVLAQYLILKGFDVNHVTDGNEALLAIRSYKPDICVLDVMMPGTDGFAVARQLGKAGDIPFIFLTAKNQKKDIIEGLKLGADDYITKPFEVEELLLRIQNILKRTVKETPIKVEIKGLSLEMDAFRLQTPAAKYQLTQKEADLLAYLMEHSGEVVSRKTILSKYWGNDDYFAGRSLDVFISRVRKYLNDEPGVRIETIRGVGFVFEVE